MKKLIFSLLLLSFIAVAGKKAVTEEGDVVILNEDGTWIYQNKESVAKVEIATNNAKFEKSSSQAFSIKSKVNDTTVWINPKIWAFEKSGDQDATEYSFKLKNEDLYGMVITEKLPIELNYLSDIAFENAKSAAPDARIVHREYRQVNGKDVLFMQMQGTMSGIDFTYLGYYFSNDQGSTQLVVYTGTSFLENYRKEMELFLNGFY